MPLTGVGRKNSNFPIVVDSVLPITIRFYIYFDLHSLHYIRWWFGDLTIVTVSGDLSRPLPVVVLWLTLTGGYGDDRYSGIHSTTLLFSILSLVDVFVVLITLYLIEVFLRFQLLWWRPVRCWSHLVTLLFPVLVYLVMMMTDGDTFSVVLIPIVTLVSPTVIVISYSSHTLPTCIWLHCWWRDYHRTFLLSGKSLHTFPWSFVGGDYIQVNSFWHLIPIVVAILRFVVRWCIPVVDTTTLLLFPTYHLCCWRYRWLLRCYDLFPIIVDHIWPLIYRWLLRWCYSTSRIVEPLLTPTTQLCCVVVTVLFRSLPVIHCWCRYRYSVIFPIPVSVFGIVVTMDVTIGDLLVLRSIYHCHSFPICWWHSVTWWAGRRWRRIPCSGNSVGISYGDCSWWPWQFGTIVTFVVVVWCCWSHSENLLLLLLQCCSHIREYWYILHYLSILIIGGNCWFVDSTGSIYSDDPVFTLLFVEFTVVVGIPGDDILLIRCWRHCYSLLLLHLLLLLLFVDDSLTVGCWWWLLLFDCCSRICCWWWCHYLVLFQWR